MKGLVDTFIGYTTAWIVQTTCMPLTILTSFTVPTLLAVIASPATITLKSRERLIGIICCASFELLWASDTDLGPVGTLGSHHATYDD